VKYTIHWSRQALDAVAQLWLDNPAQQAEITEATAAVDQLLQYDPHERGESRDDGRRIVFVPPLAVIFHVDAGQNLVRILTVRHLKRRGTSR
jgi:plasmid stabilization system protein ParE